MTKKEALTLMTRTPELYFIYNRFSNVPYVCCDEETMYDYAQVYFNKEAAEACVNLMNEGRERDFVRVFPVKQEVLIRTFSDIILMGMDAVYFRGTDIDGILIPTEEFIREKPDQKDAAGNPLLVNKTLQISMIYLAQKMASFGSPDKIRGPEVKHIEEEAVRNIANAKFYVPFTELINNETKEPMLDPNGNKRFRPIIVSDGQDHKLMPLFTDMNEFNRFTGGKAGIPFMTVEFRKMAATMMLQGVDGIVINPAGVRLPFLKDKVVKLANNPDFMES